MTEAQKVLAVIEKFPNLHILLYGMSGGGKSTMAATFPKKMLVLAFDLWDNIKPYMRQGKVHERADEYTGDNKARVANAQYYQSLGIPVTDVRNEAGDLLVRIEHYYNDDPEHPDAIMKFNKRMMSFTSNRKEWEQWQTVVLDSLTFFQMAAVHFERRLHNPGKKNALAWYGDTKFTLEELLYNRMGSANTNILVLGHEQQKEVEFGSGGSSRGIAAVGQMSLQVPAGFGECYHLVSVQGEDGELVPELRTKTHLDADGKQWFAKTQEQVPDHCEPTYEALWKR